MIAHNESELNQDIAAANGAGLGAYTIQFGDGTSDILWRNTNGAVGIWTMSNGQLVSSAATGTADSSWQIPGTGDFYGNGTDDILWRNTNGAVSIWTMSNGQIVSMPTIGTADIAGRFSRMGSASTFDCITAYIPFGRATR
jgi:hypothetical protein